MFALPTRRRVEDEAEPGKVLLDRRFVFALAAGSIQVFNAQQQAAAGRGGEALVHQRRIGVAEMQRAVGRGREAKGRDRRPSGHWRSMDGTMAGTLSKKRGGGKGAKRRAPNAGAGQASRAPRPPRAEGDPRLSSRPADRLPGGARRGERAARRARPRARRPPHRGRRAAAAALERAGLFRPGGDHRFAAGVGGERQRDLRPPQGGIGAARRGERHRRRRRGAEALRPVAGENAGAAGARRGDRRRRSISRRWGRSTRATRITRSSRSRASGRGRPISSCCSASAIPTRSPPATSRCRRRRESRSASRPAPTRGGWRGSRSAGGRCAASRRACCGPITAASNSAPASSANRIGARGAFGLRAREPSSPEPLMTANLTGPRLDPKRGPAKQLVVFLHGYGADGERSDRARPAMARAGARGGVRLAARARALRRLADGTAMVRLEQRRPRRPARRRGSLARRRRRAAGDRRLPRRGARPPRPRRFAPGAGRLQPGRDDGAARRPAPTPSARRDRRLFRAAGRPGASRRGGRPRRARRGGRRSCSSMATRIR